MSTLVKKVEVGLKGWLVVRSTAGSSRGRFPSTHTVAHKYL